MLRVAQRLVKGRQDVVIRVNCLRDESRSIVIKTEMVGKRREETEGVYGVSHERREYVGLYDRRSDS